jgi:predicted metalloprotease with PDZ domain
MPVPQALDPIRAILRPISLSMHELEIELRLPADLAAQGPVLALPAWTPGSYLVRDYARFLDRICLTDTAGVQHPVEKVDKQRWKLPPLSGEVRLRYRLFCNDLTVRTNHVDAAHAHLVGTATFLCPEADPGRPFLIGFEGFPKGWKIATALPRSGKLFRANDYDTLVDSPFELGTFQLHRWRCGRAEFEMAITGEHSGDESRIVEATERMVQVCGEIFQGFPFERYVFLLTFSPGLRGGLEHRDSTSLLADPHRLDSPEGYWELFLLIAHEFFHVWNVKRMRAPGLGPFDYSRESFTKLLWFHEGFTSFMQYLIALKAGVVGWPWVAKKLSSAWTDNLTRQGRREQNLEEASWDAWIRHYKPTEFSTNSTVSYYEKGALVAWMMEARIRLDSRGKHGLETFFRVLWQRVGDGEVTDAQLRDLFKELSGEDPEPFWRAWIQGEQELETGAIETAYGLHFEFRAPWELLSAEEARDPMLVARARGYSGLSFGNGAPVIHNIVPGSPAAEAGLAYGQEILAVNDWRTTTATEVLKRLGDVEVGREVEVLACERGRLRRFKFRLIESPARSVRIVLDPKAVASQRTAFRSLTGSEHSAASRGGKG